jgi:long-chain acyl-CoA synthetase
MLHQGLEAAAARTPDHDAIRAGARRWSFRDVDLLANAFAALLRRLGVGRGDRVAVMLSNRVEFVATVHAVSKLGAASVLLSPAWKAVEVDHALAVTRPVHAVADGAAVALLSGRVGVTDIDDLDRTVSDGLPFDGPASEFDEAVLVFSSGTTGLPKAVRHTHGSIGCATHHWVDALGLTTHDRFQVATPPSHILGLLNLLAAAAAGAAIRLHERFDLDEVLRRIESDRMTLEMAVAPIALAMANHPRLEHYDLSSLRFILWGATPLTRSVAETVTARTGVPWLQGYGASELPVIACNPVRQPDRWRLDSPGLPVPGVELRTVDLDTGAALPPGEIGEIQARSPSLMAGYLPDEANRDAFADGWYRTGDVGWLEPEGWVHLTDRAREMIKVNAFQVAPAEIEAVLHGHPSVVDCAVFGIPDERAGEVPVAAVQLDPRRPVDGGELQRLVSDSLATYKQLRDVVVVETIPRLPSGKVLRRALRDDLLAARPSARRAELASRRPERNPDA